MTIAHQVKNGVARLANIKNIIVVSAGKGGVGKSTVAINLAIAWGQLGAKIGLLDADIYGPSIPLLVGEANFKPEIQDKNFVPLSKFGIKIMSFGFLVDAKQPTIWRGAIVNKALAQLLHDTVWGELDCLIIDLPPGTGDIQLTMAQTMPLTANIVVTTPQAIALLDVGKSVAMFNKLNITCLGFVENMSSFACDHCHQHSSPFGSVATNALIREFGLKQLASIPLDFRLNDDSDHGVPSAVNNNYRLDQVDDKRIGNTELQLLFSNLATTVAAQLGTLQKDFSGKLPPVVLVK